MKDITKTVQNDVILEQEWKQHRLHQQRLRWAEFGQLVGERLDALQKQTQAQPMPADIRRVQECTA